VHIISRSNKELFLLLVGGVSYSIVVLLLLLQLHVPILILPMRKRMIQTLSMIPGLLRTLLAADALCPWSLWQLEMVVSSWLVWICRYCLHV